MKFTADRPLSDPGKVARKLVEIANATDAVQDGRILSNKLTRRSCELVDHQVDLIIQNNARLADLGLPMADMRYHHSADTL